MQVTTTTTTTNAPCRDPVITVREKTTSVQRSSRTDLSSSTFTLSFYFFSHLQAPNTQTHTHFRHQSYLSPLVSLLFLFPLSLLHLVNVFVCLISPLIFPFQLPSANFFVIFVLEFIELLTTNTTRSTLRSHLHYSNIHNFTLLAPSTFTSFEQICYLKKEPSSILCLIFLCFHSHSAFLLLTKRGKNKNILTTKCFFILSLNWPSPQPSRKKPKTHHYFH